MVVGGAHWLELLLLQCFAAVLDGCIDLRQRGQPDLHHETQYNA
jgi:hypothetical protein